jgi:hypothetical protein
MKIVIAGLALFAIQGTASLSIFILPLLAYIFRLGSWSSILVFPGIYLGYAIMKWSEENVFERFVKYLDKKL